MILLTGKDADFIANIARRELNSTKSTYEALLKQIEIKKENLERMIPLIQSEETRNKHKEELDAACSLARKALESRISSTIENFTKIIELMTSGSSLENSND